MLLHEQSVVLLLLESDFLSCSLAIDERGGHKDLHDSDRQSVIPYVQGRFELYCSILPCQSLFPNRPLKWRLHEPFIAQG
jgi:hypothetical protein